MSSGKKWMMSNPENLWRRPESPGELPPPPPDFLDLSSSPLRPHFSARTRGLFKQRMMKRRKENSAGLLPITAASTASAVAMVEEEHSLQRPNKLQLPITYGGRPPSQQDSLLHRKIVPGKVLMKNPLVSKRRKIMTRKYEAFVMVDMEAFDTTSPEEVLENESMSAIVENETISLPQSEPIPQQFWTLASSWIPVVGRDVVACLFSKDWQLREASVRRLSIEIAGAMGIAKSPTEITEMGSSAQDLLLADRLDRIWKCSAEIIAKAAEDKVYKVYIAAIKALRTLLACANFSQLSVGIRPILFTLLLKCADGQKRMADLSLETIADLCRGRLAFQLGSKGQNQRVPAIETKCVELIFQMMLEEKDSFWQYTMGKLVALDFLLEEEKGKTYPGKAFLQDDEMWIALDISFQSLNNSHSRVAKLAMKVFAAASCLLCADDNMAFESIWRMILTLNPTLQLNVKKKLKLAMRSFASLPIERFDKIMECVRPEGQVSTPQNHTLSPTFSNPPPLIRSASLSPSRTPSSTKPTKKYIKRPTPYAKRKQNLTHPKYVQVSGKPQPQNSFHKPTNMDNVLPSVPSLLPHQLWIPETSADTSTTIVDQTSKYKEGESWTKSFMLGSGAFSTCYQARDVQTGTLMAVKQIKLNRVQDLDEKTRLEVLLQQEVLLMSTLEHPHLIRYYGVFEEGAELNIFLEWMPGGSVSRLLEKHGAFTDAVIVKYTHQILQGLEYLHHNGILHRDIKGANLFVDTSGHHLRIGDFGAAACLYSQMTCPGEFRGQLQGTLAFMAPEVLRSESYGRSCDIWSLGCCIIEMATARAPWNASDISNYYCLMYKIACSKEPPSVPSHLSPALQDLASSCLQLNPHCRPQAVDLLHHCIFTDYHVT